MHYYFVAYFFKRNSRETFESKHMVLQGHPFDWLQITDMYKNIDAITLIGFQKISYLEFNKFTGEKIVLDEEIVLGEPDKIGSKTVAELSKLFNIKDKSNEIEFNDKFNDED